MCNVFLFTMQKALKKYFVNMDDYLASIGLYRKMMARDASCLFRAVSEQLYYSQNYHHKIRKDCVTFMRANRCNFEPFVEGSFEKYLERLEDPQETAGQVEIKALSLLYRRCFIIYRYPGKPPTEIAEDDYAEKVLLCCSNNGHYDIVYPRSYPVDAAMCQSLLYELLYCRVLGVEEGEVQVALEGFRGGGRRYRNSLSVCSEDAGYDAPDDRGQREDWEMNESGRSEDKARSGVEENKAPEQLKLSLPYKVLKALDPEIYRNVEFDVWHDSRKEMQKTDYMVFAGRQYFLGDKCQVRLDPKGKYYNAFIQEVGTHSSAVTVFIEELGEKHLVSLTNLKPVNPVPAWNITPSRKGASYSRSDQYSAELDAEMRGRRRFFKKPRGKEVLMAVSYRSAPPGLPPRLQPGPGCLAPGRPPPMHGPPAPPVLPYDHYRPHPTPRPTRGYVPHRSSARFLNRHHLIGPEMAYYPGKRCYQSFDNYSYRARSCSRSRRQMHSVNKECQFSFVPEAGEDAQDLEGNITFYEIEEGDEAAFPPLPGQAVSSPLVPAPATFWVQRGPSPNPGADKPPVTSSEEDPEDRSTGGEQGEYPEDFIYRAPDPGFQTPSVYTAAEATANLTIQEGGSRSGSPPEGGATYSYSHQVVVKSAVISTSPTVNSAPAAIFTSNSSSSSGSSQTPPTSLPSSASLAPPPLLPPHSMGRPVLSMPYPGASNWFVNEMGETVNMAPPPPYSYDPNGSDLPRDCKVLQYYFNLGVQWYQQGYWHSVVQMQQLYQQPGVETQFQPYTSGGAAPDHTVAQAFPESGQAGPDAHGDTNANGAPLPLEPPAAAPPSSVVFYPLLQEQCGQTPMHSYEPYVPVLPTYQYLLPWTPGHAQTRLHASFCPSSHAVSYISAPPHTAHYVPPSM
ncbi:putative bifunctional UDP-N-acetylglucosamine transferase and deubiquitinase ALG13 isoform X1 [Conger conger]|uniref:putative bifunctional UDP-N-acetylglucosamine transferase and deubiquitinase ALG13 isoform X1 n=1 Tax=Conger conger TaxID=82655 RepID=UPI002A59F75B|nr:putative bifunctional UDP-N-acetylglucosamine transferase and deubiquitinase ALG13 isoform X1 [Conger conger]